MKKQRKEIKGYILLDPKGKIESVFISGLLPSFEGVWEHIMKDKIIPCKIIYEK